MPSFAIKPEAGAARCELRQYQHLPTRRGLWVSLAFVYTAGHKLEVVATLPGRGADPCFPGVFRVLRRSFGEGFLAPPRSEAQMHVALYARVSTQDQQTLPLQLTALRQYAKRRGWKVVREVKEVGSGAKTR